MRTLIAQLKKNIYENKTEREKITKEINQDKKIYVNLESMREVAI
jgi:hypothetical protein